MSIKVDIKLDIRSMSDFMIYHIYTSAAGMVALVLGFLNIGLTISFALNRKFLYMLIFLFFAFLILGVLPILIRRKVEKQMSHSKRLEETVTYEFMDDGVFTQTSEDSGKASWKKFKKAVSRKNIIILYDAQKRAIILPVDQLGDNYTAIVDLIFAHMPAPAVRIMRKDGKKTSRAAKEPIKPENTETAEAAKETGSTAAAEETKVAEHTEPTNTTNDTSGMDSQEEIKEEQEGK